MNESHHLGNPKFPHLLTLPDIKNVELIFSFCFPIAHTEPLQSRYFALPQSMGGGQLFVAGGPTGEAVTEAQAEHVTSRYRSIVPKTSEFRSGAFGESEKEESHTSSGNIGH